MISYYNVLSKQIFFSPYWQPCSWSSWSFCAFGCFFYFSGSHVVFASVLLDRQSCSMNGLCHFSSYSHSRCQNAVVSWPSGSDPFCCQKTIWRPVCASTIQVDVRCLRGVGICCFFLVCSFHLTLAVGRVMVYVVHLLDTKDDCAKVIIQPLPWIYQDQAHDITYKTIQSAALRCVCVCL